MHPKGIKEYHWGHQKKSSSDVLIRRKLPGRQSKLHSSVAAVKMKTEPVNIELSPVAELQPSKVIIIEQKGVPTTLSSALLESRRQGSGLGCLGREKNLGRGTINQERKGR